MSRLPLLLSIAALATATATLTATAETTAAPVPAPAPPATLAELKKSPGGLEQVTGDLREAYGSYPVTAVYRRETERVNISYLVNGETVFGYRFEFTQPGNASELWQDSINQFISSTFPQDSYRHEPGSIQGINSTFFRTDHVLNVKAYDQAKKDYAAAETARLQQLSFSNTTPPLERTTEEAVKANADPFASPVEKKTAPLYTAQTIADYQKRFPDTVAIEATRGSVPGFEYVTIGDLPTDSYYLRKPGDMGLLILVHRGAIIGYVAKLYAPGDSDSMWQKAAEAGLKACFPDPAFNRSFTGTSQSYYFYRIIDKAATKAANDSYLAEEAAKMKALLAP
ncbi:hypothetical protein [Haloferula sp. BvORR071]|uniref:hypothetical protein n=1 Tax=Haloferula sp. BvORR071 TaxID=1396141 RepID=UPI0005573416|nr:hypothetical protein [Haloferula sp. BvORR071]